MSKKTASDLLKDFMAAHPQIGGNVSDWKRLSKKKDGEGHWVREFENAKTNARVEIVELADNQFAIGGNVATVEAPVQAAVSYFPVMNNDAEKERVAQSIMDDLYAANLATNAPETIARVQSAGAALANKFYFCYCSKENSDDEVPYWFITPALDWDRNKVCFTSNEAPIGSLLPGRSQDLNGCGNWFVKPYLKPLDGALELMKRGFIWNEELQNITDASQAGLIKKIAAGRKAQGVVQAPPPSPVP